MIMNREELEAKALKEFDVWPYPDCNTMVGCLEGGNFLSSWEDGVSLAGMSDCWTRVCTREEFEADKKLGEEIYWNGKEELKVGMIALVGINIVKLKMHSEISGWVVEYSNGSLTIAHDMYLIPFDNRTTKQKAIDDLKERALGEGNDAALVINLICDGEITGVNFTGE
jgi:hypothetical protein